MPGIVRMTGDRGVNRVAGRGAQALAFPTAPPAWWSRSRIGPRTVWRMIAEVEVKRAADHRGAGSVAGIGTLAAGSSRDPAEHDRYARGDHAPGQVSSRSSSRERRAGATQPALRSSARATPSQVTHRAGQVRRGAGLSTRARRSQPVPSIVATVEAGEPRAIPASAP